MGGEWFSQGVGGPQKRLCGRIYLQIIIRSYYIKLECFSIPQLPVHTFPPYIEAWCITELKPGARYIPRLWTVGSHSLKGPVGR
jgi:hypothetical protein